ncbi:MAG: transposase [Myxococcota bacterium]
MIACDQTFGTLLDYHPHSHMIVSHGVFRPDGTFVEMSRVRAEDYRLLERVLASRLLTLLVRREKLRPEDRKAMLSWPHLGFSLDASVGVRAGNREERGAGHPGGCSATSWGGHPPAPVPARRDHLRRETGEGHIPGEANTRAQRNGHAGV